MESCVRKAERLAKVLERLDEAEALYGTDKRYSALGKVGGAFTGLALAYARGVIDKDDWKVLSGKLYHVRQAILEGMPLQDVMEKIDDSRKAIVKKMVEVIESCRIATK